MCANQHFHYISNDNIDCTFLSDDGVHLIKQGSDILLGNFVRCINGVNCNNIWYSEYPFCINIQSENESSANRVPMNREIQAFEIIKKWNGIPIYLFTRKTNAMAHNTLKLQKPVQCKFTWPHQSNFFWLNLF